MYFSVQWNKKKIYNSDHLEIYLNVIDLYVLT